MQQDGGKRKKIRKSEPASPSTPSGFPVVAIGASAGGLAALRSFFTAVPADSGMAFVVVTHLDPRHESHMVDLLARYTTMPVKQVEDGMKLEPNQLHVIPPHTRLAVRQGRLLLSDTDSRPGLSMPVDLFLSSLAKDQQERAIAIILSGTGSDGSAGIRDVKAEGGVVLVQDPDTAEHEGMPRSAIATGIVDRVGAVEQLAETLIGYVRATEGRAPAEPTPEAEDQLNHVLAALFARGALDFRFYKKNTLRRRIHRRMALNHVGTMGDYVELLRADAEEVTALSKDLLIGVTGFFRDPEVWQALKEGVLPDLVKRRLPDQPIRAWVPGCASGEEAYSLAMLLIEEAEAQHHRGRIQVFATDIDKTALETGRGVCTRATSSTRSRPSASDASSSRPARNTRSRRSCARPWCSRRRTSSAIPRSRGSTSSVAATF